VALDYPLLIENGFDAGHRLAIDRGIRLSV
jgi:hypothetical protein